MSEYRRGDGRKQSNLREIKITRKYTKYAEGSVLMEQGDTIVLCTASVEDKVPPFLRGEGQGWITAEYSLLPRSTQTRAIREISKGRPSGRTLEIQRLIGRSLRSVVDLDRLGEHTIWLDCDVLQADGGTRTAAISGAFVAMVDAVDYMLREGLLSASPIKDFLAAVSVGIVDGEILLDLNFDEDSNAQVDMNLVMTGGGEYIEIQGTAESMPFKREKLNAMLALGWLGVETVIKKQKKALGELTSLINDTSLLGESGGDRF